MKRFPLLVEVLLRRAAKGSVAHLRLANDLVGAEDAERGHRPGTIERLLEHLGALHS